MRLIIFFIGMCIYEALMKMSDVDFDIENVIRKHENTIIGLVLYAFILDILEIINRYLTF